ncbi:hypothetical protein CTAYLR_007861 [Chrysophaeum taylorii]|uniref:Calmodulin n=1 Tax=Chrysophaeum taylorii TaxID=2483200 RepID=A0AAD7UCH8_9STRA|nr:hypothetical protein CTAYLR_007861 [Chrysophaeum taylorii]
MPAVPSRRLTTEELRLQLNHDVPEGSFPGRRPLVKANGPPRPLKPLSPTELPRRQLNQDLSEVSKTGASTNSASSLPGSPITIDSPSTSSTRLVWDEAEDGGCLSFADEESFLMRSLSCFWWDTGTLESARSPPASFRTHLDGEDKPPPPPPPPPSATTSKAVSESPAGSPLQPPSPSKVQSPRGRASSPSSVSSSSTPLTSPKSPPVPPRALAVQQLIPLRKNRGRLRRMSAPPVKLAIALQPNDSSSAAAAAAAAPARASEPVAETSTTPARVPPPARLKRSDSDGAETYKARLGSRNPRVLRGRKLSRSTSITLDTPKLPIRMMGMEARQARRTLTLQTETKLEAVYEIGERIGKGSFGTVRRCRLRASGEECAVKTVRRSRQNGAQGLASNPPCGASGGLENARRSTYGSDTSLKHLASMASQDEEGVGSSAASRVAADAALRQVAAATISPRKPATAEEIDAALRDEIEILGNMHHPNIINLYDVFDDPAKDQVHMVMQLCRGGELFDRIATGLTEIDAAVVATQMLLAIEYLHAQKIVHRDLKPENFMFVSNSAESDLVLIDFGVSTFFQKEKSLDAAIGTIFYTAPEVFEGEYDERCDVWSIGVILYTLLAKGRKPFGQDGQSEAMIYKAISRKNPKFDDVPELAGVSREARAFVERLLVKNPKQRPRASRALKDPWFETRNISTLAAYGDDILIRLARFKQMNDLKKLAYQLIAKDLTSAEIGFLEQQFRLLDTDGDGVITVRELLTAISSLDQSDQADEKKRHDVNALMYGVYAITAEAEEDVVLDKDEFIAATFRHHMMVTEHHIEACYRKFDRRRRGHIAVDDLYEFFSTKDRARVVFDQVDANRDGIISLEEFKHLMGRPPCSDADTHHDLLCSPASDNDSHYRSDASSSRRSRSRLSAHSRFARFASSKLGQRRRGSVPPQKPPPKTPKTPASAAQHQHHRRRHHHQTGSGGAGSDTASSSCSPRRG